VGVQDAHDLGYLDISINTWNFPMWDRTAGYGKQEEKGREFTGSSALLVLLKVAEALFTSSIILLRSLPTSSSRSDSFSASLYLD